MARSVCELENSVSNDKTWRESGLWAIETCNANSWAGARKWLRKTASDICMVQETKVNTDAGVKAMIAKARHEGWTLKPTRAHTTAADMASGGVGVAARRGLGIAQHDDLVPEMFQHRLAFSHVSAVMKGGFHCGSIWLKHR